MKCLHVSVLVIYMCLDRDILHVKCVDSIECNVETTKMSAETQQGVNWVTAEVAVMKGHADETKPGIFSDPVVHDTIVDTCENEDFIGLSFGSLVVMSLRLKMCKVG